MISIKKIHFTLIALGLLILFSSITNAQDISKSAVHIPSKKKLTNIKELNKLAIASNAGALGCGILIMEKDGKHVNLGASLSFLLNKEKKFDIEQMHAICYARYVNIILNDTSWPLPNTSLCYTATEVLTVFHNEDTPHFLCLLAQDELRQRIAMYGMAKMVDNNKKMRKEVKKCIRNFEVPVNFEVPKWMQKQMIQPEKTKRRDSSED